MALIRTAAVFAILSVNAVRDIRKKEIFASFTVAAAIAGTIMHFAVFKESFAELLKCFIPGAFMAAFSVMTKGKAGLGDAVMLLFLGAWEKSGRVWPAFLTAVLFSGIAAAVLVIKGKRNTEIPFVPFILACYTAVVFFE